MPSIKALYGILLSGLVLYFLIYSLIVKKLLVVKIYFEDETRSNGRFRQEVLYDSSLKASKVITKPFSLIHEVSIGKNSQDAADVSRKEKQDLTGEILSFLEGLGIPMNTGDVSPVNIPTTPLPRVNPNGASLPILMRKIDNYLKLSGDETCPTSHLRKVGLLAVHNNTVDKEDVAHELYFVDKGGQWKPNCKPRRKVAIVVPFRDRYAHLYTFLRHMHQFLRWQLLDYRIFIIEQADSERFNRGMLMNVGFTEAMKAANFSCVIFHDVDLLPEDARNDYSCPSSPRHMSTAVNSLEYKLSYKTLFGGVEGFWSEHYHKVNGFPNRFWGWGGEDDDLYVRITEKRLGLTRPAQMIGRYTMLHHVHADDDANPQRFEELRISGASVDTDGLKTLTYSVLDYKEMPLYTMISVSLR